MHRLCACKYSVIFFVVLLSSLPLQAKETFRGPVSARVLKVIDGDTLDVQVQVWLGQHIQTRVRLMGIDTPEMRGKCSSEKALAEKAKNFLSEQVSNDTLLLKNIHYGKYAGRILADVELENGKNLSELIIRHGYARPYRGGKRQGWCP